MAKKRGPGQPKHKDDPPVILATTIPKSLDRALREHAKATGTSRRNYCAGDPGLPEPPRPTNEKAQPDYRPQTHNISEVIMRKSLIVVLLIVIGLVVRYSGHISAQPRQSEFLPFDAGQAVQLRTDLPQSILSCKVSQVVNGFIGCAADERRQARWINLRNVQEITPLAER